MAFKFPFTNYHELNLTWILDQLKSLFEKSEENVTTIETYDGRLSTVEAELPVVEETASEASRAAAAAGTLAQTAKTTADTAQNNAIQAQTAAGTARQEAQAAQTAANEATQAAQQAQATAQNFDGRITQAENDASQALEASRSFENRVQSAITTANNANQTATNAQGIAMRADQNAGAALDKIGDLSDLTTTAKQNLVAAINEAAQTGGGGAVTSVNGKTGAVVLDSSDISYNDTTVETALNGKQNAPQTTGTPGQVLGLDYNLAPVWLDKSGGGGGGWEHLFYVKAAGTGENGYYKYIIPMAAYDAETKVWTINGSVDLNTLIDTSVCWVAPINPETYINAGIKANSLAIPISLIGNGVSLEQFRPSSSNIVSTNQIKQGNFAPTGLSFDPADFALYVMDKPRGFGSYLAASSCSGYDHYLLHILTYLQRGDPRSYSTFINYVQFANSNNILKKIQDNYYDLRFGPGADYSGGVLSDVLVFIERNGDAFYTKSLVNCYMMSDNGYVGNTPSKLITYRIRGTLPINAFDGTVEFLGARCIWGGSLSLTPGSSIDLWGW